MRADRDTAPGAPAPSLIAYRARSAPADEDGAPSPPPIDDRSVVVRDSRPDEHGRALALVAAHGTANLDLSRPLAIVVAVADDDIGAAAGAFDADDGPPWTVDVGVVPAWRGRGIERRLGRALGASIVAVIDATEADLPPAA
jgi:hypothetical protein